MIEPDDDEDWGDGTGSPCDFVIDLVISSIWISCLFTISYLLTR